MSSISPQDLYARLERRVPLVIVDVRSAGEFAEGHVPEAINVPFWRVLMAGIPGLSPRSTTIVYCGQGPRARMAILGLRLRGHSDVAELQGHWEAWQRLHVPATGGSRP